MKYFCLLFVIAFAGCDSIRYQKQIQQDIFISRRMEQKHFLKAWGTPTRVYSTINLPEQVATNANEWRGEFSLGHNNRHPYNVWEYQNHGVSLWFLDENLWMWQWHDGGKAIHR